MTELLFILIAIIGYKIIKRLPSYTPEQVGSEKWIVRRQRMKAEESTQTHRVTLQRCAHEYAWYSKITEPIPITVTDSGDPSEWYIAEGIYEGMHVSKFDCTENVRA